MSNLVIYLIIVFIFLFFSAFFSGMEAAIFSLSRFRIRTLVFEGRIGSATLERLREKSVRTLASLLLANLLVNVGASSVAAIILVQLVARYKLNATLSFIIEVIVMSSFLLIIGEITPKVITISNAESFALRFGNIVAYVSKIFNPISSLMEALSHWILGQRKTAEVISDKEIKLMLGEAKKFNVLEDGEVAFAHQLLKFSKMKVSEIMTPRSKVVGIDFESSIEETGQTVARSKHSRICVFDKKGDVVGMVYAKDLFLSPPDKPDNLKALMREPYVIPETKLLDSLLSEFRKKGVHIAVVVDEFGSFAGIITLEDVLESLFGEIVDEYDELGDLPFRLITPTSYSFHGNISIGEVAQVLGVEPFADGNERLSAFILGHLKNIPKAKEKINLGNLEIVVERVRNRTIEKVLIKKLVR